MPSFRYRALTQSGEIVSGSITAPTAAEIATRIEFLGLIPIETIAERSGARSSLRDFSLFSHPRPEDVTIFTGDLALLLKTGARINDALGLLAGEADIGRLRPTVAKITAAIMAGESFADAIAHHPALFPPMYQALARVGEASGTLDHILEVLGAERVRTEALRRKLMDALRYPAFVLFAAGSVLVFFLTFVLPQFASVLRDFNAKLDPVVVGFLALSDFMRAHFDVIGIVTLIALAGGWFLLRQRAVRGLFMEGVSRLPLVRHVITYHRTALFCRNLGVLLSSGVAPTTTLRILADMMATLGRSAVWSRTVDRVRHGGK
ncbi:MAG: ral secretion pathway protein, partial [Methylobacteriaceae bacterium]|nr:ral secretion pathway protein [Methylobacteriaceae bacterium]